MNPEFKKYLTLELSMPRVVVLLVILAILFYVSTSILHERSLPKIIFMVLVFVWGVRQASQGISEELSQSTWDRQRMSAMSAWSMVWPKLIGPSVYTWLGGVVSLVFYIAIAHGAIHITLSFALYLLLAGSLGQSLAMLLSLQSLQVSRNVTRVQNFGFFLVGVAVAVGAYASLKYIHNISWYGYQLDKSYAILMVAFFFWAWSLIGNTRIMRLELQQRNLPWVWMLFVITMLILLSGFYNNIHEYTPNSAFRNSISEFALSITTIVAYICVYFEAKPLMRFKRLLNAFKLKKFKSAFALTPCFALTYLIAIVVAVWSIYTLPAPYMLSKSLFIIIFMLFTLRDLSFFVALNIGSTNETRSNRAALFYILFSYVVIGGIVGDKIGGHFKLFFYPQFQLNDTSLLWTQLVISAIEVGAVWIWTGFRYKKVSKI